jgi:hypothetical protein
VDCWPRLSQRNCFDARLNQPREVHYLPGLIAQLYDTEDTIREQSATERLAAPQEPSAPVLEPLKGHLLEQKDGALPKSQNGQAIGYALNPWDELRRFTEDGLLEREPSAARVQRVNCVRSAAEAPATTLGQDRASIAAPRADSSW